MIPSKNSFGNGCQRLPEDLPKAHMAYATNDSVVYRCAGDYELNEGDLVRRCVNGTWTGLPPSCTAEGILPKGYMVLLIVGGIILLFLLCIPVDFYRYRKRKKVCRERRERMEMMTRIEPLHANLDRGYTVTSDVESPTEPAKFSFRSILSFFRLVRNTRKRTEEKRSRAKEVGSTSLGENSHSGSSSDPPSDAMDMQAVNANGVHKLPDINESSEVTVDGTVETELHAVTSTGSPEERPKEEMAACNPMGQTYDSPTRSSPSMNLLQEEPPVRTTLVKAFRKKSDFAMSRNRAEDIPVESGSSKSPVAERFERITLVSENSRPINFSGKKTRRTSLPPLNDPFNPTEQPINVD